MSDEDAGKLWKERADKPFEPLLTSSGKGSETGDYMASRFGLKTTATWIPHA
jgi:hypothetical protein